MAEDIETVALTHLGRLPVEAKGLDGLLRSEKAKGAAIKLAHLIGRAIPVQQVVLFQLIAQHPAVAQARVVDIIRQRAQGRHEREATVGRGFQAQRIHGLAQEAGSLTRHDVGARGDIPRQSHERRHRMRRRFQPRQDRAVVRKVVRGRSHFATNLGQPARQHGVAGRAVGAVAVRHGADNG